jgi:hypothetical protein
LDALRKGGTDVDHYLLSGDNGEGITAEQVSARSSLWILGMRERALLLGGASFMQHLEVLPIKHNLHEVKVGPFWAWPVATNGTKANLLSVGGPS